MLRIRGFGHVVISSAFVLALLSSGASSIATAQVKPRFTLAFDTSGSMGWTVAGNTTYGDGVGRLATTAEIAAGTNVKDGVFYGCGTTAGVDYDCNGLPDDSRISIAKKAVRNMLGAFGEVEWSLARFHQDEGVNKTCKAFDSSNEYTSCTDGFGNPQQVFGSPYCNTGSNATGCVSGIGASCRGQPKQFASGNFGGCINYQGACPSQVNGVWTNLGDILVGFPNMGPFAGLGNEYALYKWVDNLETNFVSTTTTANFCDHATTGDCELRAEGSTPLGGILTAVQDYVTPIKTADTFSACRGYNVILLTDGDESCSNNPNPASTVAASLKAAGINVYVVGLGINSTALNTIAVEGGTSGAYFPTDETELSAALATIVAASIKTEVCDGADNDCDMLVDEGFTKYCNPSTPPASRTPVLCVEPNELNCDGLDDDCDGITDEGLLNTCGQCPGGVEVCNGLDDDCDGKTDEFNGTQNAICNCFQETCDGLDNDCDGNTDEGVTRSCGSSVGECKPGTQVCMNGAFSMTCTGSTDAIAESCNGKDDDCDGKTDEGQTRSCGTSAVGECRLGLQQCVSGAWQESPPGTAVCTGNINPSTETCNGKDDNCNGTTDEGNPGGGAVCGSMVGTCKQGTLQCQSGVLNCVGSTGPATETCNNLDDNCNGSIDDGNPGGGAACGSNVGECKQGTTLCVAGAYICQGSTAAVTETCDGKDNDCDGKTDELDPGGGAVCGSAIGECKQGVNHCVSGAISCVGSTSAVAEICDNKDNDCNGSIDDGNPGGGAVCGSNVGECKQGTQLCVAGAFVCQGSVAPATELCNAKDDDCDSRTDELNPEGGASCGTDTGECTAGTVQCSGGTLSCAGSVGAATETCNNKDDDCDGVIDNGNPGGGGTCGSNVGECKLGAQLCVAGGYVCQGQISAVPEVCNGKDDDCDGKTDELNPGGGGTCGSSIGECKTGTVQCTAGALVCTGGIVATAETCDNKDNNCNGVIDDGNPGGGAVCGSSVGECRQGTQLCVAGAFVCQGQLTPSTESCDGKDNDCDSKTDELNPGGGGTCGTDTGECSSGALTCQSGNLNCVGAIAAVTELCNNKDDDCDGIVDNGNPGGGALCGSNVGECKQGTQLCVAGGFVCSGQTAAVVESCNSKDDDCDGKTDELNPGGGGSCGTDTGECSTGTLTCQSGSLGCAGAVNAVAETCDGKDNDCDGIVDEDNPGGGAVCGSNVGECKQGTTLCVNGAFVCSGGVDVATESCDGKDNDCDSKTDELNPGGGSTCGSSIGECKPGTIQCTGGALACSGNTAPATETCDGKDNDCDGIVDNGNPGGGVTCGSSVGQCKQGTTVCVNGGFLCSGSVASATEACNGKDDDCDGKTDELNPQGGGECGSAVGECKKGTLQCTAGALACSGDTGAATETCDGKDNDCDGRTDEGNPGGGASCGQNGPGECKQGVQLCINGAFVCQGGVTPQNELCDNKDNDCDNKTDEGNPGGGQQCGIDTGECKKGATVCTAGVLLCQNNVDPLPAELCNNLDDDCDGRTDEGNPQGGGQCGDVGTCRTGTNDDEACGLCEFGAQACMNGGLVCVGNTGPKVERCDGFDNDCDLAIDEGVDVTDPNLNQPCGVAQGECKAGTTACSGGSVVCQGGVGPMPEVCDGKDNDCDGVKDEGIAVGAPCGSDVGECQPGHNVCDATNGVVQCSGAIGPKSEICDALDNDCDGKVDEELMLGQACGSDVGECAKGVKACSQGVAVCVNAITPATEVCDCLDNDCDGKTDEPDGTQDGLCGATGSCVQCQCALPCNDRDEFGIKCATGKAAVTDADGKCFCVAEKCKATDCATKSLEDSAGEPTCAPDSNKVGACLCKQNECTFPCDGVTCQQGTVCDPMNGSCQRKTCLLPQFACTGDEVCDPLGGECAPDLCAAKACADGEACRDGTCFGSCADVECKTGELCQEGACVVNKCADKVCGINELCNPETGDCAVQADCANSGCSDGFVCNPIGGCEPDPCLRTTCPNGQSCVAGQCTSHCLGGLVQCKGTCVDPASDSNHCGASSDCRDKNAGEDCDDGMVCSKGACTTSCDDGLVQCGAACIDPKTSYNHCGASGDCAGKRGGSECGQGFACIAGACRSTAGGKGTGIGGDQPDAGANGGKKVDTKQRVLVTGGGGCACSVPGNNGSSNQPLRLPLAFVFGMMLIAARRLRRYMAAGQPAALRRRSFFTSARASKIVRAVLTVAAAVAFSALGGCKVDPFCLDCVEDSGTGPGNKDGGGATGNGQDGGGAQGDGGVMTGVPDASQAADGGGKDSGPGTVCLDKELCNAKDDDCDGKIDEDIDTNADPTNCGGCGIVCRPDHAFGECKAGKCTFSECDLGFKDLDKKKTNGCEYSCQAQPDKDDKVCDLRDNDCDGKVDENVDKKNDPLNCGSCGLTCRYAHAASGATCVAGACKLDATKCDANFYDIDGKDSNGCEYSCTSAGAELCNGLDDDCDDKIDEGVDTTDALVAQPCGIDDGECQSGTTVCTDGQVVCQGGVGPDTEVCDTKDNDCDGKTDESDPSIGPCGETRGTCQAGTYVCNSGTLECMNAIGAAAEMCDGLDNDCNGVIDNGNPGGGVACGASALGQCKLGTTLCTGGSLVCMNEIGPVDETCNGKDDDCDGRTDELNPGGGAACGNSLGECANGTVLCQGGALVCSGGILPATEVCDGKDNDCDGKFDEGNPGGGASCGSTTGECKAGSEVCTGGTIVCSGAVIAAPEICDGKDNDCNGTADDGNPGGGGTCGSGIGECKTGTIMCTGTGLVCVGSTSGGSEVCDGKDNDCDGLFDEGNPGGGASCGSATGECKAGTQTCVSGAIVCSGAVGAQTETCDGKDNDCDSKTDELNPGGGAACGSAVGECKKGVITCGGGTLSCVGATNGGAESCDGKDNDCDGKFDEGNPGGGATCGTSTGECATGTEQCVSGGLVCSGSIGVATEICNGKDDDCDGNTDEGNPGGGASCGSAIGECKQGTIQCSSGALSCVGATTGVAETCDAKDNDCDGKFDEGNPGGGATCGSAIGECKTGTVSCVAGGFVCQGAVAATTDVCDGKDNDCDSKTDELNPGGGGSCGSSVGQCTAGTVQCTSGALSCVGSTSGSAEICDGLDNDCDGRFDEGNPGGGAACGSTTGECKAGAMTCTGGTLSCAGATTATSEVCDGKDNDCDGVIDNGNPGGGATCGTDAGECSTGTVTCTAGALACVGGIQPATETCDNKDNDCDGKFDEGNPGGGASCGSATGECKQGTQTCVGGAITCVGQVSPVAEICDGKDNDCNGVNDNGNPGAGVACGSDVGECRTGTKQCTAGALVCTGSTGPGTEICDNKDNDCDGKFDELDPGGGAACGSTTGECKAGVNHCVSGAVVCVGAVTAKAETCNGKDDDCNGTVDNGNPGGGGLCGSDVGQCKTGTLSCTSGALTCIGSTGPTAEICDNKDNDCDSKFDEGNPGGGASCGSSVGSCLPGTMTCVSGVVTCTGATTATIELCDDQDNDCDTKTDETFTKATDVNNCGTCGTVCNLANAVPKCVGGACQVLACNSGFVDANGTQSDGCELACTVTGPEVCDGADNDCNGTKDDNAPLPPASFCGTDTGECVQGVPSCTNGGIQCTGTVAAVAELCDGKDNDCDGKIDENFSVGTACSVGTGGCKKTGSIICNGTAASVCSVSTPGPTANETCNNIDDDCDGFTDEVTATSGSTGGVGPDDFDTTTITTANGSVKVFKYEASRPDATAAASGTGNRLACSTAGKVPWTNVTWDEAHDACCALNPGGQCTGNGGWRLCDSLEWQSACKGSAGTCTWGYGTNCTTSNGTVSANQNCNGKEYDAVPDVVGQAATIGDQDAIATTGSFSNCKSSWGAAGDIYDMSGNVREWTNTQQDGNLFELRGGGYSNIENGRRCDFSFAVADPTYAFANTGFRCCYYPSAVSSCTTFTSTDVPQAVAGGADTGTATSTLTIAADGKITDLDVIAAKGTTTRLGQTQLTLQSPAGTTRTLVAAGACSNTTNDNWSFSLDDEAAAGAASCSSPIGGAATVQPTNTSFSGQTLSAYDGEFASGTWTLRALDAVTTACISVSSSAVPATCSGSQCSATTTITVPSTSIDGTITDVNVTVTGTHPISFGDNRFRVTSPSNTTVTLIPAGKCTTAPLKMAWNFTLDDSGSTSSNPCSTTTVGNGGTFSPLNTNFGGAALSGFNGGNPVGTWTLAVNDNVNTSGTSADHPNVTAFGLSICATVATPTITGWGLKVCKTD